jgi:hypothetical protein
MRRYRDAIVLPRYLSLLRSSATPSYGQKPASSGKSSEQRGQIFIGRGAGDGHPEAGRRAPRVGYEGTKEFART